MSLFPLLVDLQGKMCVVVGGGTVAARKATGLLAAGATVRVVAPEATETIRELSRAGALSWVTESYDIRWLGEAFLVIAATNNRDVNAAVVRDAKAARALVNCADAAEEGDAVLPASVTRGDLTVAVTTGGKSPTLAAVLRERLEQEFGPEWALGTEIVGGLRPMIAAMPGGEASRRAAVASVVEDDIWRALLKEGRRGEAETRARLCLSSYLE